MKILKFHADLVPLVLSGSKTSTWRLFDDKDLSVGDALELREFGVNEPFAHAVIDSVVEKHFEEITASDKSGHEDFESDSQMYDTYSAYYATVVTPQTKLKIIRFRLS
jgi:hypothetical protein